MLDSTSLQQIFDRSGTCSSPDNIDHLTPIPPPDYNYLNTNGYCYTISPAVKDFIACYTMTAAATSINFNAGYNTTGCTGLLINYAILYTSGTCIVIDGTAIGTTTGLTIGANYTWCISLKCTGSGPGFTSFCPYYQNVTPLPIELTDFHCELKSDNITIKWTTATETNNNHFDLERSSDGIYWTKIMTKPGAGTSIEAHDYSFVDYYPATNTYYYRLLQIDNNGDKTISKITSCSFTQTTAAGVTITYYNMLNQVINIENAVRGFYIKEYKNGSFVKREMYYKIP